MEKSYQSGQQPEFNDPFAEAFGYIPQNEPVRQLPKSLDKVDRAENVLGSEGAQRDNSTSVKKKRKKKVPATSDENVRIAKSIVLRLDEGLLFKCELLQRFYGQKFTPLIRNLISKEFESKKKEIRRMMEESLKKFD